MKYITILIMLLAGLSQPLTLKQVSRVWLVDGYNFRDYAVWAANYGRNPSIGWGLLDNQVWIPFPSQTYFDGRSSGRIKVITNFDVTNGVCLPESRQIQSCITTSFTAQPLPTYPVADPNQPAEIIEPIIPPDPNDLLTKIEKLREQDPNDMGLRMLLDLVTAERGKK